MASNFGRYVIEKKLGQGGMGTVYLAYDPSLDIRVALKVTTSDDKAAIERFHREAQAVAKLKHPNIVQVFETGVVGKMHYFTMEYIEGSALDKMVKSKERPGVREVTKIIQAIASALHYAHTKNLVHRDIKPANILIDKAGKPYLTDFGVAKQLSGLDRTLTVTGATVGTPNYMSPEQAQGKKEFIDHRSDIFSLGATYYHALTGRMPFDGKEMYEIFSKVINEDPTAPTTIVKTIPKDLETICLKCMEKDQDNRYQTAMEMAMDMERYFNGQPIHAQRAPYLTRVWNKIKRRKAASFAVASSILIIIIIIIIGKWISSTSASRELDEYRQKGYTLYGQTKYEDALKLCEQALKKFPDDKGLEQLLKQCQTAIKENDADYKAAQAAAKRREDEVKAAQNQARLLTEKTKAHEEQAKLRALAKIQLDKAAKAIDPDERIRLAMEAIKIDQAYGEAYQLMAYAYEDKNDFDSAIDNFNKAIELAPNLASSYYRRAWITAHITGKADAAIPDLEKVIKYEPESFSGIMAKGDLSAIQAGMETNISKYDEAIKNYTKAIKLSPDNNWAYINRGLVYGKKNEWTNAITDFNDALKINPVCGYAYTCRGAVYYGNSELDKSVADFNQAIKLNPRDAGAFNGRANAYYGKDWLDKAIADYNETIKLNPNAADAYQGRGNAYYDKSVLDKAIADYNEAIKLNPTDAESYFNRSVVYSKSGNLALAVTDGETFIRMAPNHPSAELMRQAISDWKK